MNYEEWLNVIDQLAISNSNELVELLKKQDKNPNIDDLLDSKIENLVSVKLSKSMKKIVRDLTEIFSDANYLDLSLVNFKKEIKLILEIANLKQLSMETNDRLNNKIKNETTKVYDILIREANRIDQSGILSMTIKNNMIKWGE